MDAQELLDPDPWSVRLATEIDRVRDEGGSDAVHGMRVAAGRMSVWIEIAGRRVPHDDLRWLRRSAATLRDVDVMLEHEPPPEWETVLREERMLELLRLKAALVSTRPAALLAAIACIPPPTVETARKGARQLVQRVLSAGERMAHDESDAHLLHLVRRRLRRLRYALEWLQEDVREVKKVQEAFGEFNDCFVALRHLDAHPGVRLPEVMLQEKRDSLERLRKESLDAWAKHRENLHELARPGGALED